MKDIPVFATEYGVASLVLREIAYQKTAYVIVQDSLEPDKLVGECQDFCSACGAERVYATGHPHLEQFPFHTAMWQMNCHRERLEDTDAALWPVQKETMESWREIYNQKVPKVPNGAWMTEADGEEMLKKGDGYFVHRGETLLGIGRASGSWIDWVAAVQPGAGRDVVLALSYALMEDVLSLTVASANEKAVRLYESLGFMKAKELSKWYRIR